MGINKDWTKPTEDNCIDVPDELMPIMNNVAMQLRLHTISDKEEILTVAHIVENSRNFFSRNKHLLD